MYTAQLIGDRKDEKLRRRIVNIKFNDGSKEFDQEFQFSIDSDVETIKKAVKAYLDELNFVPPAITDLTPAEELPPPEPTQAELDKTAWELDVARLKKAQELIECGVTFSAGQLTSLATLRTRIVTNFKPEYLG
jgi:hypothetical protein